MKKIILGLFVLFTLNSLAQNIPPVIISVNYDVNDTLCRSSTDYKIITVEVFDANFDPSDIQSVTFSNNNISYYHYMTEDLGDTRIFEIQLYENFASTPEDIVYLEDITITVNDNNITLPMTDSYFINDYPIHGNYLEVDFTLPPILCGNDLPFNLFDYVDVGGGNFYWGYSNEKNNFFDPKEYFDSGDEGGIEYIINRPNGCKLEVYESPNVENYPDANLTISNSSCGNADGSVEAGIFDGLEPYNVYWSNGKKETNVFSTGSSDILNLNAGVYYLNIVDQNGCKATKIANVSDFELELSADIIHSTCKGMANGEINLGITNSTGGTISSIFWSNGETTEDISAEAGIYSVQVKSSNGCKGFGTYEIQDDNFHIFDVQKFNYDCTGPYEGFLEFFPSGGASFVNFSWKLNGVPFAETNSSISYATPGLYNVTLTNDNGCVIEWEGVISSWGNHYVDINEVTNTSCGLNTGNIDVYVDYGTFTSWEWSNGATTEDLNNVPAGEYYLTYEDTDGCIGFQYAEIKNNKSEPIDICLLSVDSSLTYNLIVWEKEPSMTNIATYNIYRETPVVGVYEKIAERNYGEESLFIDNSASPMDRSWRYYISYNDACGVESYNSQAHKTIHVVIESTDLVNYNLSWDDYEGINYSSIDLYRYEATNGWQLAESMTYGTFNTTDIPADITDINYMLTFNLASSCTSTKAQDHNASRSNKTSAIFNPGGETGLSIIENEEGNIYMYPNPTQQTLNIRIENNQNYQKIEVYDLNGRLVLQENINNQLMELDLSNLNDGIYFVKIISDTKSITEKIIKN